MNSRPLTEHARAELREIIARPVPRVSINPGVAHKLVSEGLAEEVQLPSPFKVHKGGYTAHLQATDAGRAYGKYRVVGGRS